jgi:hypothetical protein
MEATLKDMDVCPQNQVKAKGICVMNVSQMALVAPLQLLALHLCTEVCDAF